MNTALAIRARNRALPKPAAPKHGTTAIRRIFNNDQLIERFDKWLLICGKAANTRLSYALAAKQFAQSLVNKPLTAVTKEDVRAFVGYLYARNLAATTIQARLDALRVLGDFLTLGGQVRICVPRYILRRKLPKRLPHAKSEEEIESLITGARTPRDLAIIELGYASALRVSELANLRIEDLNLSACSLVVRQGKGGNDRVAHFGRPAALREYLGERTSGPVFLQQRYSQRGSVTLGHHHIWYGQWRETDEKGKRVLRTVRLGDYELPTKQRAREVLDAYLADKLPRRKPGTLRLGKMGIYRVIVKAAKRAGLVGVHPHILRHSCATHCLNRGMDIRFVQELLGHTSLVATQKYLHLATVQIQSVHAKFHPRG
jgi:integrase/recombinase XerD